MINTHFKSKQNQFWHLDTEIILSPPLYILLGDTRQWTWNGTELERDFWEGQFIQEVW